MTKYKAKHIKIHILLILSVILVSCSSSYYLKKGEKEYDKQNFYNANLYFSKIKNPTSLNFLQQSKIADNYYKIKDFDNALKIYKNIELSSLDAQNLLNYAQILQFYQKFDQASKAYKQLKNKNDKTLSDSTIDNYIKSCELAKKSKPPKYPQYKLYKTKIDVKGESFGETFYKNGIIYSAPQINIRNYLTQEENIVDRYGNNFKTLFYAEFSDNGVLINNEKLLNKYNKKHHIGNVCYYPDSNKLYFAETEKIDNNFIIKIYSANIENGELTNKTPLPFNSNDYSCAQPSISKDGKKLYFVSDMPGGYGGTDIYVSNFENGKWSKPINLGNEVNTEADEIFPYIKKNNVLYFSSNGKIGFGGFDIYYALFKNNKWTHIVHKDRPLNSYADDFAYIENPNNKKEIIISSNRNNLPKDDSIYYVKKLDLPPDTIRGKVFDDLTDKELSNAVICLLVDSLTGDTIGRAITDENGNFTFVVPKKDEEDEEHHLFAVIKHEGYEDKVIPFNGRYHDTDAPPFSNIDVAMKVKIVEKKVIEFHNMYFDFGKADLKPSTIKILDKLANVMKENPKMEIELSAHTDSKSSKKFNLKLSQKRANNAKKYLLTKGISSNRIIAKGYGERFLLNRCKDGVDCTEEEHAINRRIEVKILKN